MRREMRRIAEEIRGAFEAAGWDAGEPIGEEADSMEM